jgi:hypothetical protein
MEWLVLLLLVLLALWSLSSAGKTIDQAMKTRREKGPCPYCSSLSHGKSFHVPGTR